MSAACSFSTEIYIGYILHCVSPYFTTIQNTNKIEDKNEKILYVNADNGAELMRNHLLSLTHMHRLWYTC